MDPDKTKKVVRGILVGTGFLLAFVGGYYTSIRQIGFSAVNSSLMSQIVEGNSSISYLALLEKGETKQLKQILYQRVDTSMVILSMIQSPEREDIRKKAVTRLATYRKSHPFVWAEKDPGAIEFQEKAAEIVKNLSE